MHLDKDFLTIPQIPPHSWKYQITPLSLENIKFEVCILSLHCQCWFTKLQSFLTIPTLLDLVLPNPTTTTTAATGPSQFCVNLHISSAAYSDPAHPLAFAGFRRFVASKNQFVRGKKVSRPRGRDGVVPEKGKSVCDPLRVRADLSEGGVTSNLDQRVILWNEASSRGHYFPLYSPEYAN